MDDELVDVIGYQQRVFTWGYIHNSRFAITKVQFNRSRCRDRILGWWMEKLMVMIIPSQG